MFNSRGQAGEPGRTAWGEIACVEPTQGLDSALSDLHGGGLRAVNQPHGEARTHKSGSSTHYRPHTASETATSHSGAATAMERADGSLPGAVRVGVATTTTTVPTMHTIAAAARPDGTRVGPVMEASPPLARAPLHESLPVPTMGPVEDTGSSGLWQGLVDGDAPPFLQHFMQRTRGGSGDDELEMTGIESRLAGSGPCPPRSTVDGADGEGTASSSAFCARAVSPDVERVSPFAVPSLRTAQAGPAALVVRHVQPQPAATPLNGPLIAGGGGGGGGESVRAGSVLPADSPRSVLHTVPSGPSQRALPKHDRAATPSSSSSASLHSMSIGTGVGGSRRPSQGSHPGVRVHVPSSVQNGKEVSTPLRVSPQPPPSPSPTTPTLLAACVTTTGAGPTRLSPNRPCSNRPSPNRPLSRQTSTSPSEGPAAATAVVPQLSLFGSAHSEHGEHVAHAYNEVVYDSVSATSNPGLGLCVPPAIVPSVRRVSPAVPTATSTHTASTTTEVPLIGWMPSSASQVTYVSGLHAANSSHSSRSSRSRSSEHSAGAVTDLPSRPASSPEARGRRSPRPHSEGSLSDRLSFVSSTASRASLEEGDDLNEEDGDRPQHGRCIADLSPRALRALSGSVLVEAAALLLDASPLHPPASDRSNSGSLAGTGSTRALRAARRSDPPPPTISSSSMRLAAAAALMLSASGDHQSHQPLASPSAVIAAPQATPATVTTTPTPTTLTTPTAALRCFGSGGGNSAVGTRAGGATIMTTMPSALLSGDSHLGRPSSDTHNTSTISSFGGTVTGAADVAVSTGALVQVQPLSAPVDRPARGPRLVSGDAVVRVAAQAPNEHVVDYRPQRHLAPDAPCVSSPLSAARTPQRVVTGIAIPTTTTTTATTTAINAPTNGAAQSVLVQTARPTSTDPTKASRLAVASAPVSRPALPSAPPPMTVFAPTMKYIPAPPPTSAMMMMPASTGQEGLHYYASPTAATAAHFPVSTTRFSANPVTRPSVIVAGIVGSSSQQPPSSRPATHTHNAGADHRLEGSLLTPITTTHSGHGTQRHAVSFVGDASAARPGAHSLSGYHERTSTLLSVIESPMPQVQSSGSTPFGRDARVSTDSVSGLALAGQSVDTTASSVSGLISITNTRKWSTTRGGGAHMTTTHSVSDGLGGGGVGGDPLQYSVLSTGFPNYGAQTRAGSQPLQASAHGPSPYYPSRLHRQSGSLLAHSTSFSTGQLLEPALEAGLDLPSDSQLRQTPSDNAHDRVVSVAERLLTDLLPATNATYGGPRRHRGAAGGGGGGGGTGRRGVEYPLAYSPFEFSGSAEVSLWDEGSRRSGESWLDSRLPESSSREDLTGPT